MSECPHCAHRLAPRVHVCPGCGLALERPGLAWRWLGLALGALYFGQYVLRPSSYALTDYANLAIHEGGHLVWRPFGDFLYFLGGSLTQVLFPLAFALAFWRTGQHFSSALTLLWVSNNLFSVSVYVNDARAQTLELVGGDTHDWNWLLGRLGWLEADARLGGLVYALGLCVYLGALGWGAWLLLSKERSGG